MIYFLIPVYRSNTHQSIFFGSLTKNTEGGLKLLQRFKFKNERCQLLSQIFSRFPPIAQSWLEPIQDNRKRIK
jgi:hypothetical protein